MSPAVRHALVASALTLLPAGCASVKGQAIARAMDRVWNEGDLTVLDEGYAPDVAAEVREFVVESRALYPDIQVSVDDWIVAGPRVVTLWTASGTHKDLGKPVTIHGVSIRRIEGRRVVSEAMFYDQKAVYDQLGFRLIPPEGATPFGPVSEEPPGEAPEPPRSEGDATQDHEGP